MAPRLLGLVVEGPGDARTVPGVTDRILAHETRTLEGDLERVRAFQGLRAGDPYFAWSAVDHEARHGRVPRRHGHFGGEPALEDARTAWYALQCFVREDPQPDAVLLVRDSDGKLDERVRGLEQARDDNDWPFPVVIGVAHTMRECWALAGFIPQSKAEKAKLAQLRKELGFDPTVGSARLGASKPTATKSPKRVLSELTGRDHEREAQCWTATDLQHLRERGADNGLSAFMNEVEERLVPIIAGQ